MEATRLSISGGGAGIDDLLDLIAFAFTDTGQVLAAASDQGGDTTIQLDANVTVTLLGVASTDLHGDDFLI